jgi:hypothetical protein
MRQDRERRAGDGARESARFSEPAIAVADEDRHGYGDAAVPRAGGIQRGLQVGRVPHRRRDLCRPQPEPARTRRVARVRRVGRVGGREPSIEDPSSKRQHHGVLQQRTEHRHPVHRVHGIGSAAVAVRAGAEQHETAHVVGVLERVDEREPAAPRVADEDGPHHPELLQRAV